MTPHQAKLLEFIRARIEQSGVSPSYVEMGEAMGLRSRATVFKIVNALVRDGHLRRPGKGRQRGLMLPGVSLHAVPTSALVAELKRRGVPLG